MEDADFWVGFVAHDWLHCFDLVFAIVVDEVRIESCMLTEQKLLVKS